MHKGIAQLAHSTECIVQKNSLAARGRNACKAGFAEDRPRVEAACLRSLQEGLLRSFAVVALGPLDLLAASH
jgi:hypothetical protein